MGAILGYLFVAWECIACVLYFRVIVSQADVLWKVAQLISSHEVPSRFKLRSKVPEKPTMTGIKRVQLGVSELESSKAVKHNAKVMFERLT